MAYGLKAGDLEPPMIATLTELGGAPIDLTEAASVTVRIERHGADETEPLAVDREAVVQDAEAGIVAVIWEDGETAVAGTYGVEFAISWPDDRPQTVPTSGTSRFRIEPILQGAGT